MSKELGKYSFGTGDRFGKEGKGQLKAIIELKELGVAVTPVWNKSDREHKTVGSQPESVEKEARIAVRDLDFQDNFLVDADHINLETVNRYINSSDFFTIDVAQYIGRKGEPSDEEKFLAFFKKYEEGIQLTKDKRILFKSSEIEKMLHAFLFPMKKASEVYFHIKENKNGKFFTEVSIDEVEEPQSPAQLFFILAALAFYGVPVNTIAPKFTGNFYKGIDYEGDLDRFKEEFEEDIQVLKFAIQEFDFPENLKLSVHSGSDKFSIYPVINKLIKKHNIGLHLKTAGTTWLEEAIGLAESEGDAFRFIKELYAEALQRFEELTENYAEVLDIDTDRLPGPDSFQSGKAFANALRHDQESDHFNPHFRQLMHCAYKIAGERKEQFFPLLEKNRAVIEERVTHNLLQRHLKPLFI